MEEPTFADSWDGHSFGEFPHHCGNAFEIRKVDCICKEVRDNVPKIWKGFRYNTDLNIVSLQILIGICRSSPRILQSKSKKAHTGRLLYLKSNHVYGAQLTGFHSKALVTYIWPYVGCYKPQSQMSGLHLTNVQNLIPWLGTSLVYVFPILILFLLSFFFNKAK